MNIFSLSPQLRHCSLVAALSLLTCTLLVSVTSAASPGLRPAYTYELRAVWAHYYGIPNWEQTIQSLHQANFNAVFPYMCSAGVAYYPSHILPVSEKAASHDYLAEATTAGYKYGIQVHARMLVLEALFASEQTKARLAAQGRLMHTSGGDTLPWLCPTNPYNREQLIGVALEIVRNYPVAGLQLDYIRYPHRDCCYCEHCRRKFIHDTFGASPHSPLRNGEGPGVRWPQEVISGPYKDAFIQWRQQQITSLVAEIATAVKSIRPHIAVSAAAFPDWPSAKERFGQDATAWAQQGLVDFICPMNYTADIMRFTGWLRQQQELVAGQVPLVAGLGPFSDACQFDGPQQLVDQILIARGAGASGFVVFNYNQQFADDYLPYLTLGVTSTPAPLWPSASLSRP